MKLEKNRNGKTCTRCWLDSPKTSLVTSKITLSYFMISKCIKEKPEWLIDALNYQIKLSYRLVFQLVKIIVCLVAQFIPTCTK